MEIISLPLRLNFRDFCVGLVLRQIDDIFQMAGIQPSTIPVNRDVSGARRTRVEEYYASIDWTNLQDVQKFLQVLGLAMSQTSISDEQRNSIRKLCSEEGLIVDGHRVRLPSVEQSAIDDLFVEQFPGGLPFGRKKPDFAITAKSGGQSLKFELAAGIGVIWRDVYPDFDFQMFQAASGITQSTNLSLKKALLSMNQTDCEKSFFQRYARFFNMADNHVPMLIPQAWVQWHSLPKRLLKTTNKSLAEELFRVDFVAFWASQRYAILVDDISHYAVKGRNHLIADEEAYSKRLAEDRKLQIEGWKVFRVSNWEIRYNKMDNVFVDLQKLVGF